MEKKHILSGDLQGRDALELSRTLGDFFQKSDKILIDFKEVQSMTPFAMIFIISQLRNYRKNGKEISILNSDVSLSGNDKMNFFGELLKKENSIIKAHKNSTSIPVTHVIKKDIIGSGIITRNDAGELVNNYATKITNSFLSNVKYSEFLFDIIQYSTRELIRNIIEHSDAKYFLFCADYNKKTHTAEICISDNGMGIYETLKSNPFLLGLKPDNFLKYSCLPGISGNRNLYSGISSNNIWENSGFGLYMIRRICQDYGGFFLISNNHGLYRGRDSDCSSKRLDRKLEIPDTCGTTIRLNINIDTIKNQSILKNDLSRYIREAEKYKKYHEELVINPSMASQMLQRDFKK
ncbi:ATP-binding protein [Acetobacter persici]|uniref:ATP-binding protein n=1 Tax=Acetobacter persici TaxID=1076596 RepID=UPI001BA51CD8|nr:ATP-binding protein [Acetobacter persici]MBS1000400.1 ATP-binding protein [Acetobacter persici]